MYIKEILKEEKGKEMDHILLIKFLNMLEIGKKTLFLGKEDCLEMENYFFKEISKWVLNMGLGNINMIMETLLKVIILKMKKEAKENIILSKVEYYNHNLILIHLRYPQSIWLMVRFIQANKEMVLDRVLEKQFTWMDLLMTDNGIMTRNMVMDSFSMLMVQNITDNGKKICAEGMEHIIILITIDMKVIGIMIFKMVWEHITIPMEIFIKDNGLTENLMDKETIFIVQAKEYIREIGKKEKNKDLES